jgi:hypothetical protein
VKLNEQPVCSLCKGKTTDRTYVWIANEKTEGGQLVHKMCFNDSRREEQEALREARKAARLEAAKLEAQKTSQSKDTVVEVDTLRVNSQTN